MVGGTELKHSVAHAYAPIGWLQDWIHYADKYRFIYNYQPFGDCRPGSYNLLTKIAILQCVDIYWDLFQFYASQQKLFWTLAPDTMLLWFQRCS